MREEFVHEEGLLKMAGDGYVYLTLDSRLISSRPRKGLEEGFFGLELALYLEIVSFPGV